MKVINKTDGMNEYRRRDFGSFDEYLKYAESPLPADVQERYEYSSVVHQADNSFNGATYDVAFDRANKGWQDGWEIAKKMSNMFRIDLGETALRKRTRANYHGQRVNMGNYLVNNPRNMNQSKRNKLKVPGKIISIFVHGGMLSDVKQSQIINRGASILALVEALELSGYRVRLNAGSLAKSNQKGGSLDYRYPLKPEDQPIDKDRLGFALVSPAMHRVVSFRAREHEPLEFQNSSFKVFGSYGATREYNDLPEFIDFENDLDCDIYLGVNKNNWKTFNTEASSKEWLKEQFEKYGVKTDD